jgi:2-oxoglutarate dehydrogenase E2 component (dihydrolipoamide succinyltransferase)
LVLNIAASEGVSLGELEKIPGTGNEGRVTKKDILHYVSQRKPGAGSRGSGIISQQPAHTGEQEITVANESSQQLATQDSRLAYSGNVEIIEMDRMRRLIADHMVRSKHTSPHVTSFTESDVTNLVVWRDKVKNDFEKREGTKITFTPLFIEAVIKCIKKFPLINSSVDGDRIVVKKDINIGMATALPSGSLIVPVIKGADQLNLVGLTKQVNTLADNARNNKLRPEDTQSGTFTLTNVGTFGSLMGTPIINQPQVAILAVGAIKKRPVVIETPHGDSIAIRHMMYLSLSYDHRIIDGSLGATFLTAVANELQNFNADRDY